MTAQTHADAIDDAIASADRPAADRERDLGSHPAQVLHFFGVPAGGVALDLFAGGGYYSEILTRAMGPGGTVYMHNNAAYLGFAGEAVDQRLANGRLPQVIRYDRELDAIDLADDSVDLVLMVMTYHDLYYKTDGWDLDPESFFATIHRVLKPGGTLAVVDHAARPGTGTSAAQDLHRIDPAYAKADIEGHGFELVASSTMLENPDDPLDVSVFDPVIRGRTSKFVYKFVEPGD
ncbi:MAG: class I SAM-dependent methyltransferase [Pseudomonadales bacterium]